MHADSWRSERIIRWECQSAPVLPVVIGCVGWAGQDVVPFEDVGFARMGGDVFGRVTRKGGIFASKSFMSGFGCHCRGESGGIWAGGLTVGCYWILALGMSVERGGGSERILED